MKLGSRSRSRGKNSLTPQPCNFNAMKNQDRIWELCTQGATQAQALLTYLEQKKYQIFALRPRVNWARSEIFMLKDNTDVSRHNKPLPQRLFPYGLQEYKSGSTYR